MHAYAMPASMICHIGVTRYAGTSQAGKRPAGYENHMQLRIGSQHLNGITVIVPEVFEDDRGFFMEVFRADQFGELGLPQDFVQDNHSRSVKNVLRGLHFQWDPPMGKLM